MNFGRRRKTPFKLYGILAGVAALALVGATFWFAGEAEKNPPEQTEIRVEATNVGAR